jgi:pimeloyl-ACP methyl ester carboxylesterase
MSNDLTTNGAVVEETTIAGFPALVGHPGAPRPGAPTALFLHGAFADHEGFRGWVQRFAESGYPCVAASRRGRLGVGPVDAAGLSFDDYVDDTLAVIDAAGSRPILVGHSLGGLVAQRVAERGRAHAIALLASAPPAMLTARAIALPRFAPNVPRIMTGRPFIVGNDACSVLALNQVPASERPAIHAHLTHESGKVYRSMMMGTIRVKAAKVQVPVFVGGGTEDRIISTRLLRKTARHYGIDPRVYEGHGHWILKEPGWEQVADDVLAWLRAQDDASE